MSKKIQILFLAILVVAALLRFVGLGSLPPSLNWDEISHGYNAYSILKTGADQWGQNYPIFNFRAYGDYPLPLNMYLTIPSVALLGLNAFSIRFISALLGVLTVAVTYFLTQRIFKKQSIGLLAAFLIAVSPWTVFTSRQVLQSNSAVFFLALGVWLFIKGIEEKSGWVYIGTISLGLTGYAYHNTRILTPILLLVFILLYRKVLLNNKKMLISLVLLAGLFFLPLIPVVLSPQGSARASWVGILDQGAINQINEARGKSTLPPVLNKLMNNRIVYFSEKASENYIGYFSPYFLGINGGTQYQFSIPGIGIIYPIDLIFLYIGLIYLITKFTKLSESEKFILIWTLIGPLPAAITRDPYQVVRATTMLPAMYLIIAFGVFKFLDLIKVNPVKARVFWSVYFILFAGFFFRFIYNYVYMYPTRYSFAWQYGYEQAVSYIEANQDRYSKVVVTKKYGEPHEYLLFFMQYDPASYRNDPNLVEYYQSDWYWVDSFSKYLFVNDWEVQQKVKGMQNTLLVTSPGNYPPSAQLLKTIYLLDGEPAFDIVKL